MISLAFDREDSSEQVMPFYVMRRAPDGEYLSMRGDSWVRDVKDAVVYTSKSTATSAIRRAWRGVCTIERIARLPDRTRGRLALTRGQGSEAVIRDS
jgi:hypothetical protein